MSIIISQTILQFWEAWLEAVHDIVVVHVMFANQPYGHSYWQQAHYSVFQNFRYSNLLASSLAIMIAWLAIMFRI